MKNVLTSLASRKLETAHRKALLQLQEWQDTVERINSAAAVAEHELSWELQAICSEAVSVSEIKSSSYLVALHCKEKIAISAHRALATANDEISSLVKTRTKSIDRLREEINREMKRALSVECLLDKIKTTKASLIRPTTESKLNAQPKLINDTIEGSAISTLIFLLLLGPLILSMQPPKILSILFGILLLAIFSIFSGFIGIQLIKRNIWSEESNFFHHQQAEKKKETDKLKKDLLRFETELVAMGGATSSQIPSLKEDLRRTELLIKKAQDAVAVLTRHHGNHSL